LHEKAKVQAEIQAKVQAEVEAEEKVARVSGWHASLEKTS
jgi:hypothetical protein